MARPKNPDPIARTAISMPVHIYQAAKANAIKRGFGGSFSAYVAWLIQRDHSGDVERETIDPSKKGQAGLGQPALPPNPHSTPGAPSTRRPSAETDRTPHGLSDDPPLRQRTARPGGGPKARSTRGIKHLPHPKKP